MWVTQARVDRDREILLLGAAQPKVLGLAQGWRWLGVELKERWGGDWDLGVRTLRVRSRPQLCSQLE
jgi:hypothetical protein